MFAGEDGENRSVSAKAYQELLGVLVRLWAIDCCPWIQLDLARAISAIEGDLGSMVIRDDGFLAIMDVLVRLRALPSGQDP
jgi:hypothetical protein